MDIPKSLLKASTARTHTPLAIPKLQPTNIQTYVHMVISVYRYCILNLNVMTVKGVAVFMYNELYEY